MLYRKYILCRFLEWVVPYTMLFYVESNFVNRPGSLLYNYSTSRRLIGYCSMRVTNRQCSALQYFQYYYSLRPLVLVVSWNICRTMRVWFSFQTHRFAFIIYVWLDFWKMQSIVGLLTSLHYKTKFTSWPVSRNIVTQSLIVAGSDLKTGCTVQSYFR